MCVCVCCSLPMQEALLLPSLIPGFNNLTNRLKHGIVLHQQKYFICCTYWKTHLVSSDQYTNST